MKIKVSKSMFRVWYWYVSKADKNADVLFMNYGFSDKNQKLALNKKHEANRYSIQLYHHLVNNIEISKKDIIEVGCGRGGGLAFITSNYSPASAVGIDITKRAISFCNRHYDLDNLFFSQGDAQELSFANNSFDVVINVESSHRYPNFRAFLNEVKRILRPSGYFLFTDFRSSADMIALREELIANGMSMISERDITAEVIAALDSDDQRKRELVRRLAPGFLHKIALAFATVKGSETYNKFVDGKLVYYSFVMRKLPVRI